MQHTIAAVFDNQAQAQQALSDLVDSGFSQDEISLTQNSSEGDVSGRSRADTDDDDDSFGSGIKSFFSNIFGNDSDDDAELYSEAVKHGNYVLTLNVPDDELVERATEVLDKHNPVDIDERASQWKSGGWAAAGSMRQDTKQEARSTADTAAIPVIQEELKVGKRTVQRGGVRIYQRMVETPVQEDVTLREEHVTIERRVVDEPASAADLSAFKEGSFELRETAEEPVVEKVARVVEEVVVGKEVEQREEQISDTLRSTEVEVEQVSGNTAQSARDDDEGFRSHWQANLASFGTYEDYAPAYRYGSTLRSNSQYSGRDWDEIEPHARNEWESRNSGSTWEKIKSAVRHGWQKMT